MKRHWWKRGLSALLAAAMILTAQPFADGNMVVYAAEQDEVVPQEDADVVEESEAVLQNTEVLSESEDVGVSEMEIETVDAEETDSEENAEMAQSSEEPADMQESSETSMLIEETVPIQESEEEEETVPVQEPEEEEEIVPVRDPKAEGEPVPVEVLEEAEEAETVESENQPVPIEPITEIYINPLYSDVITEEDLIDPSESGAATLEVDDYCTTLEDAGAQMRTGMKERTETIVISYETSGAYDKLLNQVSTEAMKHTGNPKEGDYLRWQYGGWQGAISGYSQSGVYYLTLTYTVTYYTTAEQETTLDAKVVDVLTSLNVGEKNDYEKVTAVYDYLCKNITYDNDNLNNTEYKLKYTAYAALINGTAVCQGYAVLFYRFALEMGVDARLIAGTGNGGAHGWNIVQLDGSYYNLDATWDAPRAVNSMEYDYFLKCNANFENHVRDDEYFTEAFLNAYPMGESDYTPYKDGLVFANNLAWTWDESSGVDRIIGINRKGGEGVVSLDEEDWQSAIEEADISQLGDEPGFWIPSGHMALFFKKYDENAGSYTYTLLERKDISLSNGVKASIANRDGHYLEVHASEPEPFEISYTYENKIYRLPVRIGWPEVGVFSSMELSEETLLNDGCRFNNDHHTFYLRLAAWNENESIVLDPENPFVLEVSDEDTLPSGLVQCTSVGGSSEWYELQVDPACPESFNLRINAVKTSESGESWDECINIWFEKAQDSGLALANNLEFDEEGNIVGIWADGRVLGSEEKDQWSEAVSNDHGSHSWPRDGVQFYSIPNVWFAVFLAEYDINSEENYAFTPLSADQIEITGEEDEDVSWEMVGDYIHITSRTGGSCTLHYTTKDRRTYTQEVVMGLPGAGFYQSYVREAGSLLTEGRYDYNSENRTFYLIYDAARGENRQAGESEWKINGEDTIANDAYFSAYVISDENADAVVQKITVAETCMEDFYLEIAIPYISTEDENDIEWERQGIHVKRGQDTGLVFTSDFEWDDNGNIVGIREGSYSRVGDAYETELTEGLVTVAFSQFNEELEEWEYSPLAFQELKFTPDEGSEGNIELVSESGQGEDSYIRLISHISNGCPAGTVSYTVGEGESAVTYALKVGFCYPEVGFYTDAAHTELITDKYVYSDAEDEVIYLYIASRDENQEIRLENVFADDGTVPDYEEVLGQDHCYAISIAGYTGDYSLRVECSYHREDHYEFIESREIYCMQTGLVAAWPEWDDQGNPYLPDDVYWTRAIDMSISNGTVLALGIRSADGRVERIENISAGNIAFTSESMPNTCKVEVWLPDDTQTTSGFVVLTVPVSGQYVITYIKNEDVRYSMNGNASLPQIGFYSRNEYKDDAYLMNQEFIYNSTDGAELYLIADQDDNFRIENLRLEVEDGLGEVDGYLTYEDVTPADVDYVVWKVMIRANAAREFGLRARADYMDSDEEGNTWFAYDADGFVYIRNEAEKTRVGYYDGEAYTGYRACFISEMEFKSGYLNEFYGDPVYWVHADTITDAMEKLVALSGTTVTASDGTKLSIENTGYIHVGTSTFYEYQDNLKEEGVVIPKGIQGVQMDEDYSRQFLMKEQSDGSYVTDQSAQVYRAEGGDVKFFGVTVWIEEGSTFAKMDGTWYYCEPAEGGNGYVRRKDASGEYDAVEKGNKIVQAVLDLIIPVAENVYMVYDSGASFPTLHIAASADVTINGNGIADSLSFGFYKNSDAVVTIMDCKDVEHTMEDGSTEVWDDHVRLTADSDSGIRQKYIYYYDEEANCDVRAAKDVSVTVNQIQQLMASTAGTGASAVSWATSGLEDKLEIPAAQRINVIDGADRRAVLKVDTATASSIGSTKVKAINAASGVLIGSAYYNISLSLKPIGSMLNGKLSLTFTIPSAFNLTQGTVKIVRYSDGKAEVLSSSVKSGKVTFQTDKMGTFAIVLVSNLKYKVVSSSSKTISVTGTSATTATALTIPSTVQYQGSSYKVTTINSSAFKGNTKLKSIAIGSYVTSIGTSAFQGCTKLATLTIGAAVTKIGDKAFYGCTALTKVTIPNKVTTVGTSAFQGCTKLATLTMGTGVTTIGGNAFYGCKVLKTMTINTTKLTSSKVGSNAFKGIYAKAKIKVPGSKLSSYKTILKAKGVPSTAVIY